MSEAMAEKILEPNLKVLRASYEDLQENYDTDVGVTVPESDHDEEQVLVSGSHGIAYGAIDEGCRFIAGYPMTPWTDVFTIMTQHLPEVGGISEQVEDEIAAAALAIGASHAGVKAMSGSSGGGFALMSEPLGLAEMTETPIVLVEAMRAGPSTGMPTKPEQGDLEHVLYTSQGDSNRVVFAPGDARESYIQTRKAFGSPTSTRFRASSSTTRSSPAVSRRVPEPLRPRAEPGYRGSRHRGRNRARQRHTESGNTTASSTTARTASARDPSRASRAVASSRPGTNTTPQATSGGPRQPRRAGRPPDAETHSHPRRPG